MTFSQDFWRTLTTKDNFSSFNGGSLELNEYLALELMKTRDNRRSETVLSLERKTVFILVYHYHCFFLTAAQMADSSNSQYSENKLATHL